MWPFNRKANPLPLDPTVTDAEFYQFINGPRFKGDYSHSYVEKRLPGPGARNYAFESLGLVEFSPIGPSTVNRQQFRTCTPVTLTVAQTALTNNLGGVVAGQFSMQPLYNPDTPLAAYPSVM